MTNSELEALFESVVDVIRIRKFRRAGHAFGSREKSLIKMMMEQNPYGKILSGGSNWKEKVMDGEEWTV